MALADGYLDQETGLLKISWSRLRTMEECPQKQHLITTGHKSPIADVRNYFQGNVCDLAMRRWLDFKNPPAGWMAEQVDVILADAEARALKEDGVIRWRHSGDRENVRTFCRECVTRLEPLLNTFVLPQLYEPAVRFKAQVVIPGLDGGMQPVLVTGEMDVLTQAAMAAPRQIRVWDLKATKDANYWRKTVAQLVFYDIACLAGWGEPAVEVGLLQPMVDDRPYISFTPSDQDRLEMYGRIINVAHAIWLEDFHPKAGTEGCSRCEVRHGCIRYQPVAGSRVVELL